MFQQDTQGQKTYIATQGDFFQTINFIEHLGHSCVILLILVTVKRLSTTVSTISIKIDKLFLQQKGNNRFNFMSLAFMWSQVKFKNEFSFLTLFLFLQKFVGLFNIHDKTSGKIIIHLRKKNSIQPLSFTVGHFAFCCSLFRSYLHDCHKIGNEVQLVKETFQSCNHSSFYSNRA